MKDVFRLLFPGGLDETDGLGEALFNVPWNLLLSFNGTLSAREFSFRTDLGKQGLLAYPLTGVGGPLISWIASKSIKSCTVS